MRCFALACDYDGTIAHDGIVSGKTLQALQRVKASGRKLILVTGRQLEDLFQTFPQADLFDCIVAENGALLYWPGTGDEKILCEKASAAFVFALKERGVTPAVGRAIVATWEPHQAKVLETIRDLGLELHVIFNKGAVMVLPSGVNKATGLKSALQHLGLSVHNVVAVGDAENDHAFLEVCECSVAVANALPAVKERVDWVTAADHGAGVIELIDSLIGRDLSNVEEHLARHHIALGVLKDGKEIRFRPCGSNILIAGASGAGKSTFVTGFFERLVERDYQCCVLDPEGDYAEMDEVIVFGDNSRSPTIEEVAKGLDLPQENVVVNMVGIRLEDRPGFFARLFPALHGLRVRTGRPHWIIIDELHHVMPNTSERSSLVLPAEFSGGIFVTVDPQHASPAVLSMVDLLIVIGERPREIFESFCRAVGERVPQVPETDLAPGEAIVWWRKAGTDPVWMRSIPPKVAPRRHVRKYMDGELPEEGSFYFVGPEQKLHLRAQNLQTFLQLADGVDDDTWTYHLRRKDYSKWFRTKIKDEGLAGVAENVENDPSSSVEQSKARIRDEVRERYTAPV